MKYLIITILFFITINESYCQLNYISNLKHAKKQARKSEKLSDNQFLKSDSLISNLFDDLIRILVEDLSKQVVVINDSAYQIDTVQFQSNKLSMLKISYLDGSFITFVDYESLDADKEQKEAFELLYMQLLLNINACSCIPNNLISYYQFINNILLDNDKILYTKYDFKYDFDNLNYIVKERIIELE